MTGCIQEWRLSAERHWWRSEWCGAAGRGPLSKPPRTPMQLAPAGGSSPRENCGARRRLASDSSRDRVPGTHVTLVLLLYTKIRLHRSQHRVGRDKVGKMNRSLPRFTQGSAKNEGEKPGWVHSNILSKSPPWVWTTNICSASDDDPPTRTVYRVWKNEFTQCSRYLLW